MIQRFGFNGATTGPHDLMTDLRAAAEAGYQALEIRDTKLEAYLEGGGTLATFRRELSRAGVEAGSVNALERSTLATGAARESVLRRCDTLCGYARALDCPYVVAVPSFLENPMPQAQVQHLTVDALRAMAYVGRRHGVRIGFEFLGFPGCSVNTLAAARRVVELASDESVGLVIDAFHFYAGGSTWDMLEGLDPRRLFLVHLDDAEDRPRGELGDEHRLLPGEGVIPLREFVRRLESSRYQGLYSIELFRPEYYAWDPVELARLAKRRMEALFENVNRDS